MLPAVSRTIKMRDGGFISNVFALSVMFRCVVRLLQLQKIN